MVQVEHKNRQIELSFRDIQRINVLNHREIKNRVKNFLFENEKNVILNLKGICFIDTSGFNCLLDLIKTSRKYNTHFYLSNVSAELDELIQLMSLKDLFNQYKMNGDKFPNAA